MLVIFLNLLMYGALIAYAYFVFLFSNLPKSEDEHWSLPFLMPFFLPLFLAYTYRRAVLVVAVCIALIAACDRLAFTAQVPL